VDWVALKLTLFLALLTVCILLPIGLCIGRLLAYKHFKGKAIVEALIMLPLVMPPTVIGFYLLSVFSVNSPIGRLWDHLFGHSLAFSFEGLLIASIVFNLPFAVQPIQRGFESIPQEIREAAASCGMSRLRAFHYVELPLAWPNIATALALTFTHTLGEFGIVLMVGGAIPGETRTISIAIYDRVQTFDTAAAASMSLLLLCFSLVTLIITFYLSRRVGQQTHAK